MRSLACLPIALALASCARGDIAPEKLAAFRLDGSPLLKGFAKPPPEPAIKRPFGWRTERASEEPTTLEQRWRRGATELRCTVTLHRSPGAASAWVQQLHTTRSIGAPFGPPDRIQPFTNGWAVRPGDTAALQRRMAAARTTDARLAIHRQFISRNPVSVFAGTVVGSAVIEVWLRQRQGFERGHPEVARRSLPASRLMPFAKAVAEELVRRAQRKAVPTPAPPSRGRGPRGR